MCIKGEKPKQDYNSYSDEDNFQEGANSKSKDKQSKFRYNTRAFQFEERKGSSRSDPV